MNEIPKNKNINNYNSVLNTEKIEAGELVFRIGKAKYNLLDQADATKFQETIDLLTRLVFEKTESRQYAEYHDRGTVFYVNKQTRERKFVLGVGDEVISEYFLDKDNKINQNTPINNSTYSAEQIDLAIDWLTDAKNMYLRHIPATNINEIYNMVVDILKGVRK